MNTDIDTFYFVDLDTFVGPIQWFYPQSFQTKENT
jgi:hypothetical protein